MAVTSAGDFLIVWESRDQLFGHSFSRTGRARGGPFRLDMEEHEKRALSVAVDPAGSFVTVFSQRVPDELFHVYCRLLPSEARGGAFHFADVQGDRPIEGQGTARVLVRRTGGSTGEASIDYLTVDGSATASPAFQVGLGERPRVSSNAEGHFIVWADDEAIRGRRFDRRGRTLGDEMVIAARELDDVLSASTKVSDPQVARLGGGIDVVVWYERYEASDGWLSMAVRMQIFDGRGAPIDETPITLTEGYLYGDPQTPWAAAFAVTSDRAGHFVVACHRRGRPGQLRRRVAGI